MSGRSESPNPPAEVVLGRRRFLLLAAGGLVSLVGAGRLRAADGLGAVTAGLPDTLRPTMVVRDEPLATGRSRAVSRLVAARSTPPFDLLGLHWRGPGAVWFRTRDGGAWSDWQRAVVHELPDAASDEAGEDGWHLGTPFWTDGSDAVQFRLDGRIDAVRAHYVASPAERSAPLAAARRDAGPDEPAIIARADWGADEGIVRARPHYAPRLVLSIVHHTAGRSPASPAKSAALVRAIQVYHVKGNGWNDIGYNFLVDRFGQIFEGRGGGVDRNVIGAHALGYNTGSTGVSLLGNYQSDQVSGPAESAIAALLAWRLDVGHVDPLSLVTYVSGSRRRELRAVSGHRDVNDTDCPGKHLYDTLDTLAADAAALGLPKLYEPRAERPGNRTVRFTGRLSEPLDWTVTLTGPTGFGGALARGNGTAIDWTWDGAGAPAGRYAWTMEAGPTVRPANGSFKLGGSPPSPPVEPPPPPARPGSVPRRIPRWAWQLRTWQSTLPSERGPRPATPRPVPRWYWDWINWLEALARWKKTYGPASG